jgi:predicted nucleotidyltransferase
VAFQSQIEGLLGAGVRFVVIGGVAAALQGLARATFDLDICYDPAPDNRARLAGLLKSWAAYPRGVEAGLPFIMDAKQLEMTPVLTLTTALGDLDILDRVAGVGDFQDVWARSVEVEAGGLRFRILDLAALIAAKRAAGRPKDREQLPELEALRALRRRRRH